MATLMHSESRRLYSWWWDSHNSPKNSKWLQENLTDMDAKVKAMIKLIEEDADSFARRAEMYYKKRPELMKLVEEFYRAYRALAERYNNATGELRQAHRTMAQAFPDQVPFALTDDAASGSESDTPETPHPIRSFTDPDFQGNSTTISNGSKRNGACTEESNKGISRKGLKQLSDIFQSAEDRGEESCFAGSKTKVGQNSDEDKSHLSKENEQLKSQINDESERASKAETELQALKLVIDRLEAERDAIFCQYQEALNRFSTLESDLSHAQTKSRNLDEQACITKTEIQALRETLKGVEVERDSWLLQCRESLERLAVAEDLVCETEKNSKELSDRASKAELESKSVNQELSKLKSEKEATEVMYKQCLETIAALERKLALSEESLKRLADQFEKAEAEVSSLEEEIRKVNVERDTVACRYEESLKTISELQHKLIEAQTENSRLNSEILLGSVKVKGAEDQCLLLGKMNESLQLEAKALTQKIAAADEEISRKQAELDKFMGGLQEEHSRFIQAEATLHTLRNLHSESQQEQRNLALELKNVLQLMKDLEICKKDVETENKVLKDENKALIDLKTSSSKTQLNLEEEILRLKEIKDKLEAEVRRQTHQTDALQIQVKELKKEIEGSCSRYQTLVYQLESAGLDPKCFVSSVKALQDENLSLSEISERNRGDKEVLLQKLEIMEELLQKNSNLESSLLEVNAELKSSKEKAKDLQDSCRGLIEEKAGLVAEKSSLFSQLQMITETMQNLIEKNTLLQTSLCGANSELEGLREKSKGLEDLCQQFTSARANLLAERHSLVTRLELVEKKLDKLEMRFTNLEDRYSGLEKEKHSTLSQVEDLKKSLDIEKQERACLVLTSEARFSGLESHIHCLKDENKYRKKEFEEQLEKAVNAQVEIFILQKFIQDMEDKNYALLVECQGHINTAKYSEKLITELECENMIQQVEAEIMLDKIDTLRAGINQVLKTLDIKHRVEADLEQNILPCVVAKIRDIQHTLSEGEDENQHLLIEKSILSTLLGQLHIKCSELTSRKAILEQESLMFAQQLSVLENEKHWFVERNRQLNLEVSERIKREEALKVQLEDLNLDQKQLHEAYFTLQVDKMNAVDQSKSLQLELVHTKKETDLLEKENSLILAEGLACSYQSVILKSYGTERALQLDEIVHEMKSLEKAYSVLKDVATELEEKLLVKETENVALKVSIDKFEEKQVELDACNVQLRLELLNEKQFLNQREKELAEKELKLKVTKDVNRDLCSTIQGLEEDLEDQDVSKTILVDQIVSLSEINNCQEKELVHLRECNETLESEVGKLHEEIEERKIREVILTSELHEKSSEFELWEAEAASFYFDLQISSIREVLYQSKVHDLGNLCEGLEEVTTRRSVEIERMKQRVSSLEKEAETLKAQLTTFLPLIDSLKANVALLENNPVLQSKLHAVTTVEEQETFDRMDKSSTYSFGLSELSKLQSRVMVIEDILSEEKEAAVVQEHANANTKLAAALKEIEVLKSQINKGKEVGHRYSTRDSVSDMSEIKGKAEMKDIPLDQASGRSFHGQSQRGSATSDDQMLELWEAAEQDSSNDQVSEVQEHGTDAIEDEIEYARSTVVEETGFDPIPESHFEKELGVDKLEVHRSSMHSNRKASQRNVSERLASDAQKLMSLQVSVQELKRKVEPQQRRKKSEDADLETFRRQLKGIESSVVQLMDMNAELMKNAEESSKILESRVVGLADEADSIWQKNISEQARKEAENIGRVELEIRRMQDVLLRLKDEKKSKSKDGVSRSSTAILLREFFYSRGRKNKKRKSRFCGCLRSTSTRII